MAYMNPLKAGSFKPTLVTAYPEDELIIVKDAHVGQPIRRWLEDWFPPLGVPEGRNNGALYTRLMDKVNDAIQDKELDTIAFGWMQGERDANLKWSKTYQKNLQLLINNLKEDLDWPSLVTVIGRISDFKNTASWQEVRAAQVAVATADPLIDWVNTDDLNRDVHYTAAGYVEFGKRLADATIALLATLQ